MKKENLDLHQLLIELMLPFQELNKDFMSQEILNLLKTAKNKFNNKYNSLTKNI